MDISAIPFAEDETQPEPDYHESGSMAQVGSLAYGGNYLDSHWKALDTVYMEFPPQRAEVWPVVRTAPCEPFNRETNNALIERVMNGDFE